MISMTNANSRTTPQIPVPKGVTSELDGVVVGNGPAQVEAYIDFQCPFCRQFELSAGPALDRLLSGGMISLVRHPMNFLDETSLTQYSSRAAAASAAAADAGRFHEYARLLFENQPPEGSLGLSDDQLIELGDGIGIAEPEFAETIQRGTYLPWPSFVTRRATERGVAGTPSVFVDGIPVPARPDSIAAAVERVRP
jgi:protein-disulfide isomerase